MCARRASKTVGDPKVRRLLFRAVAFGLRRANPELAAIIDEALDEKKVVRTSEASSSSSDPPISRAVVVHDI